MTAITTANRIAPYLSEPAKTLPPLPATREGREAVLTDAVFAAVAALQGLLTHADPKVVMRAAEMILGLETTRQRHGRAVIGMEMPAGDHPPAKSGLGIDRHAAVAKPRRTDLSNPLDLFIEKVRAELQSQEDADGTGVIVSGAMAEDCARFIQANAHRPPFPPAGRPVGLDSTAVRPDAIPRFPVPAAKECRPCPSPTRPRIPSPCPTSSPATDSPAPAAAGGRTAPR